MNRNDYGLFFVKKGDPENLALRLPVNPEELPVSRDTENSDENVLGLGPIMIPRIPALKKITISSYFPGKPNLMTHTPNKFEEPYTYINFFVSAMKEKTVLTYTPVRVYENGTPYMTQDIGFDVLVTNFEYTEKGGETGDFYYSLEITEYKDYSPLEITFTGDTTATGAAVATTEQSRSIPEGQLYVGAKVTVNGSFYYTSGGEEPHGNGNGRTAVVSRIITNDENHKYSVHITDENGGALGWIKADALTVVSEG